MTLLTFRNYDRLFLERVYASSMLRYGTPKKVLNVLRTEWAYRQRITDVRSAPYILLLEPLYYCNLECRLCESAGFFLMRLERMTLARSASSSTIVCWRRFGDYFIQCDPRPRRSDVELVSGAREHRANESPAHLQPAQHECTLITPEMVDEIVSCGFDYRLRRRWHHARNLLRQPRPGVRGRVEDALAGTRRN
jgi:hypothetical protein